MLSLYHFDGIVHILTIYLWVPNLMKVLLGGPHVIAPYHLMYWVKWCPPKIFVTWNLKM